MSYSKVSALIVLAVWLLSTTAHAEGVFLKKKRTSHELSKTEQRKINIEFLQKFGSNKPVAPSKASNPWEAKKQRKQTAKVSTVSWAECRDYALQQRNLCYKEGRQAYHCERYYESRSKKCNEDY